MADVTVGGKVLRYLVPNSACLMRAQTLFSKEPHTITWLNTFPRGGNFLDIGANVGMYSIYIGVLFEGRIFAFEPEAQNYALLNRNIMLNGLGERAMAWCSALSDESRFDRIYLSDSKVGGSCHSFGEQVDPHLRPTKFQFAQGSCATTIDALVSSGAIPVPTYIKIDVDGFEHKVIKGGANTLRDPTVQSLIVEVNSHLPEHHWIVDHLSALGFRHDTAQFEGAQRKQGFFQGVGEYVFRR